MSEIDPSVFIRPDMGLMKRQKLVVCRDNVPSVHGRMNNSGASVKSRISNHQRNLSLDFRYLDILCLKYLYLPILMILSAKMSFMCNFRSMGILLPPVTQVTTISNTHLTLHHRNRSLDSALQRIPEVDVTPSPECETSTVTGLPIESHPTVSKGQRDELASLGSDDSGILCGSDSGSSENNATRESSVEHLTSVNQSRESLDCGLADVNIVNSECVVEKCSDDTKPEIIEKCVENVDNQDAKPCKDLLLRLLESKMFDVTMAIPYLFQSKEPGVQSYIANKMFSFPDTEVDFYLPQLVCMYIQMHDVAEAIHPYLVHR